MPTAATCLSEGPEVPDAVWAGIVAMVKTTTARA